MFEFNDRKDDSLSNTDSDCVLRSQFLHAFILMTISIDFDDNIH